MQKHKINNIIGFLTILFFTNCAQQVSPNGGIKDDLPPKLMGSKPLNKSTNFNSEKIGIKFNENVLLKDPSQIVISPLLKEKPAIDAIGNTIEINFLTIKPEPNTTYTINFGNSIVDVNEGNTLIDFTYVFATGYILDSNTVGGIVMDAFTNKVEKDIVIGLYKNQTFYDSIIYRKYPAYFGKSKETGAFEIQNLPNDTFKLIAFKDENLDNKYQKNEKVAFTSELIIAVEETNNLRLKLFEPNQLEENTIIDSLSKFKGIYQFCIYHPQEISIKPKGISNYYTNYSKGKEGIDTLNIYIPNTIDSNAILFEIKSKDSLQTCYLKTKNKSKYKDFTLSIETLKKPTDSIYIHSNLPIENLTTEAIKLQQDTIFIKPKYFKAISNFEWVLYYPFAEGKNYTLTISDSSVKNIYGKFNKSISSQVLLPNSKSFGNLIMSIENIPTTPIIFQLIEDSPDEKVVYEQHKKLPSMLQLNNLNPGSYKVKIIEDLNNNSVWDKGDLKKKQQPEQVFYFNKLITIKAYWDIEQNIDLKNIITN